MPVFTDVTTHHPGFVLFIVPISLSDHDLHQLVEVEAAVLVLVRLVDEPGRLFLAERVSDVGHQVLELLGAHRPAPVLVQGPEGESDHLLVLSVAHLVRHHVAELWQFYFARSIGIVLKCIIIELNGVSSVNGQLTLLTSCWSSISVGLNPMTRMAQPSSRGVMKLSWSWSHSLNASFN